MSKNILNSFRFSLRKANYHSYTHLNKDDYKKAKVLQHQILDTAIKGPLKYSGFNTNTVKLGMTMLKNKQVIPANGASLFDNMTEDLIDRYLDMTRIEIQKHDSLESLLSQRIKLNVKYLHNAEDTSFQNRSLRRNLGQLVSQLISPLRVNKSLNSLYELSDDLLFYSGDESHSFDWYEKRVKIASIFVKTELFMLSDFSEGFELTFEFLRDQMKMYYGVEGFKKNAEEWALFNGFGLINLVQSQMSRG